MRFCGVLAGRDARFLDGDDDDTDDAVAAS